MTRRELAAWLADRVRTTRLARIGGEPAGGLGFEALPPEEQANWLDMASVVLDYEQIGHPVDRLRELTADWVRYHLTIGEPEWRREMQRAVVVEMRHEVDRLAEECED